MPPVIGNIIAILLVAALVYVCCREIRRSHHAGGCGGCSGGCAGCVGSCAGCSHGCAGKNTKTTHKNQSSIN